MAWAYEIKFINKSGRFRSHERIDAVCGINNDGTRWEMPVQEAIAGIEKGTWKFYVAVAGRPVWVVVAVSRNGTKYLKTENDDELPLHLLRLRSNRVDTCTDSLKGK